ncbi:MAG: hypothetical protein J0I43_06425 [Microbacterium sp.]|uniref:hypothetical protein n=1 Tax=Microbacterium sp. TaxID=51671 RepID=UPI001ACA2D45|nr:hypothetical protein [Microbacterium sp.]MBN9176986.1 hypothetical protein [Microbacterium sp.]
MAAALGISPGGSSLRTQGFASSAYGLTGGGFQSAFSMAPLEDAMPSPTSQEEHDEALVKTALKPELFTKLFEAYTGKKYPETQFLVSALKRNFDVADGQAEACADIFTKNMKFVGLLRDTRGGIWLVERPTRELPGC